MAVRPLLIVSSKKRVGFLNSAAVRAFPIEMFAPRKGVVEAFDGNEIAAVVHDGDRPAGSAFISGFGNCGSDDLLRAGERQSFFLDGLPEGREARAMNRDNPEKPMMSFINSP